MVAAAPAAATGGPTPFDAVVDQAATHDPRGLLPASRLKILFFLCQAASVVAAFASPVGPIIVAAVSLIVLMVWSAMAVANARRARLSSPHSTAPRPMRSALVWLSPLIVGIAGGFGLAVLDRQIEDASSDQLQTLYDIRTFGVIGWVVAIFVSLAIPYGNLAKATRWARGNGGRFWRWFWSPFIAAILAGIVRAGLIAGLRPELDGGTFSTSGQIALVLILITFILPAVAWLWMGWKAMTELEQAASITWNRAANPVEEIDPGDRFALAAQRSSAQQPPVG